MKNITILFAAIFLFGVSGFAQIKGRVVDDRGNGIPNVSVWATGEDGAVAATATTDQIGNYALNPLGPGRYKITAKGPTAFQPTEREDVNVAADETTTLDIMLTAAKVDQSASNSRYIKIINDFLVNIEVTWDNPGRPEGFWRSAGRDMPASGEEITIDIPAEATNIRLRASYILGSGAFDRLLTENDMNRCYRTTGAPDYFFDNVCVHIDKAELQRQQLSSWLSRAAAEPAGHINEQASYASLLLNGIDMGWQDQMTIYEPTPVCTRANIKKESASGGHLLFGCRLQVYKGIPLNNSPAYQCEKVFGAGKCTEVYLNPGANDSGSPANGLRGYIGRCPTGQFILHRYHSDPITSHPAGDDYYCARPFIPK